MNSISDKRFKGYKTIRLPIAKHDYNKFINDVKVAKKTIDNLYEKYPELFPKSFGKGYVFNGKTSCSIKQGYQCRRIKLNTEGTVYTIAAGFLMPYMTALTEEVEIVSKATYHIGV